jgi:hypothetical protein
MSRKGESSLVGSKRAKPVLALQSTMNFSQTLQRVLEFHLFEGASIIDPTPGERHSWQYYLTESKRSPFFPPMQFDIRFIKDDIMDFALTKESVREFGMADAIFFDPPYIFGTIGQGVAWGDNRQEDYGGYHYGFSEVEKFMKKANEILPDCLKEKGLLFLKYTDVFSLKERKFYFCPPFWSQALWRFGVIDHYIIQHHHISPTAWQVKDRPCGIVNYTYLTVFRKGCRA